MMTWLSEAAQDARYGARMLRRTPLTTTTAIVTLTIGLGLTAVVFSLMNAVLLLNTGFLAIASTMGVALSEADIRKTGEIVRQLSEDVKARSERLS